MASMGQLIFSGLRMALLFCYTFAVFISFFGNNNRGFLALLRVR